MDGAIGEEMFLWPEEVDDRALQPDTCDFPGCYLPAVHFTAAGTKYCQKHKPYTPGSSGMFKKHDGTEFDQRKKP